MKRTLLFHFLILIPLAILAQGSIQQRGIAYRYNGQKAKTPLGKVYIKVATAPNGVLSDSINGAFTLHFSGLSVGSRIGNVQVQKRGMMIFNQQVVDEWSIRKEPLRLILCDADEFEKQKQNLIAIGQREAKKRYDKKIAEIEANYEAESIEWYQKLNEADKELQNIRKHIGEYADLFARIDESEVDTLAQKAIELFNHGKIEEAVRLFEEGHYMDKLKVANRAISQGEQIITSIQQEIERVQNDKETYIHSLKAQIEAYKLQGEYSKAGELLKALADELNTLEDNNEYAWFCKTQNNFTEAERYFLKMLAILDTSPAPKQEKCFSYSAVYHSLGETYLDIQDYPKSEEMLKKALAYRRELVKEDSLTYLPKLTYPLNDLGILYKTISESELAEKYYLESLNIKRIMYVQDSINNTITLAKTLCNLGNLYASDHKYEKSETMLNEALLVLHKHPLDSEEYKTILATTNNSLGLVYGDINDTEKAEKYLLQSLDIKKEMARKNPDAYNPAYALSLNNTAIMYCKNDNYELGEKMFLEALKIYEELVKRNPDAYETALSRTYGNLGILYKETKKYQESKTMYKRNIDISKRKYAINPIAYGGPYANMLANFANLYGEMERVDSQLVLLKESYSILKKLTNHNSERYSRDYADVSLELGNVLFTQESYLESANYYADAIPIFRQLAQKTPKRFLHKLSSSLLYISSAEIFNQKFKESELYAREGIEVDPGEINHYTNLAASLLLQGKYTEAKSIYRQYKKEAKESFLDDLKQYTEKGIIPKEFEADVRKIRNYLDN